MIRLAFATSDGIHVDRHFGAAERFDVYELDTEKRQSTKVDTRMVGRACLDHTHHPNRMHAVVGTIADCHAVFAECAGPGALDELEAADVQEVDTEDPVAVIIGKVLCTDEIALDPRVTSRPKERLLTRSGQARDAFLHLAKRHPCMSGGANVTKGRIHLPVSPRCNIHCRFCTRCFDKSAIKPGVTSLILKPDEAIDAIERAQRLCPELSVVGIAGPGDTLATDDALDTFELVKERFPQMICCLSTNGFLLPNKVDRIARIGIETVTVTVNAVDPTIEEKINEYVVDEKGVLHRGTDAAKLLISRQLEGIRRAVDLGIVVKINSVLVPGVNDRHIEEVARVTSELGASIMNVIPLIPQNEMADIPAPDCEQLEEVRRAAGKYITVFRHCQHCRADSVGIPGLHEDLHSAVYEDAERPVVETFSHG